MNDIKFMFNLIRAVVWDNNYPEASDKIDWKKIYDIAVSHGISNLLAYGIIKAGYNIPNEIFSLYQKDMYSGLIICENQTQAFKKIFEDFDNSGIEYMPVKGTVIREIYPSPDMRTMTDGDFLIHDYDFEKFNQIMIANGYTYDGESNHEYNYTKLPVVRIELHKYLVPTYNYDWYEYYGDGWKYAEKSPKGLTRYELGVENHFVYIITHFAKHYRDGGVGIKPVIDIWLYKKRHVDMNIELVDKALEKLNLKEFYSHIEELSIAWFENGEYSDLVEDMTEFILDSNSFGLEENKKIAETIRKNEHENLDNVSRLRYVRAVFPSLEHMTKLYPVLSDKTWLLPLFWIKRIFSRGIFGNKTINEQIKTADIIKSDNIAKFSRHIENVGLDIYNGK